MGVSVMSVYAIVPVKNLSKSKARLSNVLSQEERQLLTLAMLEDVLRALRSSVISRVVVIGSDLTLQALTSRFGLSYIFESSRGLNQATQLATEWCVHNGAASTLIVPADVPLITGEDINRIVKLGSKERMAVIAPSADGGTNALFQKPPNLIPASFGPDSFINHAKRALSKRIPIKFYYSKNTSLDIDSLDDLRDFLEIRNQTISRRFLERIRVDSRLLESLT
jgi:2-phospho-L-lactate guanylyltransferase